MLFNSEIFQRNKKKNVRKYLLDERHLSIEDDPLKAFQNILTFGAVHSEIAQNKNISNTLFY